MKVLSVVFGFSLLVLNLGFYEAAFEAAHLPHSASEQAGKLFGSPQWHMHSHFIFPLRFSRITMLSFRVSDMTEFVRRGKTLKRGSGGSDFS